MQNIVMKIDLKISNSIFYKLINYPDGQSSVKINLDELKNKEPVKITCRVRGFDELEVLLCLTEALIKNDFIIDTIEFIYLFGMRSDRAFSKGEPNYFRDIIIPILERLPCKKISILSPHNVSLVCSMKKLTQSGNIKPQAVYNELIEELYESNICILGGDQSTLWGDDKIDYKFEKNRIEGTHGSTVIVAFPDKLLKNHNKILIVDDLCDGGNTFIEEAKLINKQYGDKKELYLYVTHGLFTNGLNELLKYFKYIICTNSYQNISHPRVKQIEVYPNECD